MTVTSQCRSWSNTLNSASRIALTERIRTMIGILAKTCKTTSFRLGPPVSTESTRIVFGGKSHRMSWKEYFRRVWAVQEFRLAKTCTKLCGRQVAPLKAFRDAIRFYANQDSGTVNLVPPSGSGFGQDTHSDPLESLQPETFLRERLPVNSFTPESFPPGPFPPETFPGAVSSSPSKADFESAFSDIDAHDLLLGRGDQWSRGLDVNARGSRLPMPLIPVRRGHAVCLKTQHTRCAL